MPTAVWPSPYADGADKLDGITQAFTVCFALLGSMVIALTLVPVLATFLFRKGASSRENSVARGLSAIHSRVLQLSLRRAWAVVAVAGAVVAGAIVLRGSLGTEFLPSLDEGTIWIRSNLPPGTSLGKTAEIAAQLRATLRRFPKFRAVASQAGRNDAGTDPSGPNRVELLVTLRPYGEWAGGRTQADLVADLSRTMPEVIPGGHVQHHPADHRHHYRSGHGPVG